MTVTNQDVKIYRGDSASLEVALTNADGTEFNPALPVTIKYRLSRNSHTPNANALVSKSNAIDDGITVDEDGIATITLEPTNTDLVPGLYYHELKIFDGSDDVATAMTGTVVIKKSLKMTT